MSIKAIDTLFKELENEKKEIDIDSDSRARWLADPVTQDLCLSLVERYLELLESIKTCQTSDPIQLELSNRLKGQAEVIESLLDQVTGRDDDVE